MVTGHTGEEQEKDLRHTFLVLHGFLSQGDLDSSLFKWLGLSAGSSQVGGCLLTRQISFWSKTFFTYKRQNSNFLSFYFSPKDNMISWPTSMIFVLSAILITGLALTIQCKLKNKISQFFLWAYGSFSGVVFCIWPYRSCQDLGLEMGTGGGRRSWGGPAVPCR